MYTQADHNGSSSIISSIGNLLEKYKNQIISSSVSGTDRALAISAEKVVGKGVTLSFNELRDNLKKLGYNHSEIRNFLRSVPRDARDFELDLPKSIKLVKGFGALISLVDDKIKKHYNLN